MPVHFNRCANHAAREFIETFTGFSMQAPGGLGLLAVIDGAARAHG
jgi:hypothetical protein